MQALKREPSFYGAPTLLQERSRVTSTCGLRRHKMFSVILVSRGCFTTGRPKYSYVLQASLNFNGGWCAAKTELNAWGWPALSVRRPRRSGSLVDSRWKAGACRVVQCYKTKYAPSDIVTDNELCLTHGPFLPKGSTRGDADAAADLLNAGRENFAVLLTNVIEVIIRVHCYGRCLA